MQPSRRSEPKRSIAFPDGLWNELVDLAARRHTSVKDLVNEGARFRLNYAKASDKAKSIDPARVFQADPRLLDDLRRWCNAT